VARLPPVLTREAGGLLARFAAGEERVPVLPVTGAALVAPSVSQAWRAAASPCPSPRPGGAPAATRAAPVTGSTGLSPRPMPPWFWKASHARS
jgi:hypothetical protein